MNQIDWIVLFGTLALIVSYGIWKSRDNKNIEGYLLGDKSLKWWTIGLSVMATQASAITFLSTPGQAFEDGMRFVQFYFGLPLAMVILSITAIPIYYRLKVFTAYEYLETRFDLKTRSLAAFLFLIQRGLGAGITIYAPSIILSTILGWSLFTTNFIIGFLVIIYTVAGGTKAVSQTQKLQMAVMMGGMITAGVFVILNLPTDVSFGDAMKVAGKMGKMNIVNLEFDLTDRYNLWSGLIGGMFLALAYFGTDQSQVSRYLSGKSIKESRLGLLFNGLLKVPMQFIILFIGMMVFVFYVFNTPPVYFNQVEREKLRTNDQFEERLTQLENEHNDLSSRKAVAIKGMLEAMDAGDEQTVTSQQQEALSLNDRSKEIREEIGEMVVQNNPDAKKDDRDYVFINFVMNELPIGVVGLLFAVIFSAAMSSTSSELNALASTTTVDVYKRSIRKDGSPEHYLKSSRWMTLGWGMFAIAFATFATEMENLIQAVNILGSLFYGTILGIFVSAFYVKYIKGTAVFIAALITEAIILGLYFFTDVAFLLYNIIGCLLVVFIGLILQRFMGESGN